MSSCGSLESVMSAKGIPSCVLICCFSAATVAPSANEILSSPSRDLSRMIM